ncbi:AMP-dependent synthetase/ligase [Halomarina halobia]|uniref:AMP-dependent synthetase/ligase n=1 Tax=Halomarina halobia TaxID=3033386 RepID=A0ABD6A5R5_9EURY|nr:long-chain fatty acid--CoA ligase [Halomarina sp. PSR21]
MAPDRRRTADLLEQEREYTDAVIGSDTTGRLFEASAKRNADRPAQGYKGGVHDRSLVEVDAIEPAPPGDYATLTYREMRDVVHGLAAGFRTLGVTGGDRVGIFANTRMEWAQTDFALLQAGAVVTTVYAESTPRKASYLLSNPGATGVVVENAELLERVLEVEDALDLSFVVVIDEVTGYADRDDVFTLGEVYERGREAFDPADLESWLNERSPGDLATLVYTSGTTGEPKGVRLTHANLRANINGIRRRVGPRPDKPENLAVFDEHCRTLSFLPLAHIFERTAGHLFPLASGACVNYAESADTVAEDIRLVSPTNVTSVPRVYERIYDSMRERASESDLKSSIFERAVETARERARTDSPGVGLRLRHALYDRLVYRTIRTRMGGEIEFFISGGGSLSLDLAELFAGMGLHVLEGYGLTETAPVVSVNPPEDPRPGTLGPPLVDVEVRLDESVVSEDRKRRARSEIGELLVRGPNVTAGYWERPDATEAAFTADGYFRTGDIVEQTDDGYLIFHDRLKQLLVLSTGKNVAPSPIEDAFSTSDRVEQVMVVGDDRKFVGALVVLDFEAAREWADRAGIDLPDDPAAVCRDDRVRAWVAESVEAVNATLESEARIKRFELVPEEWTVENDMLTPSMKKKRRTILDRYEGEVMDLYAEAPLAGD